MPQGRSGVFEVPSNVTKIEAYAIDSCSKLTEVRIGSNVVGIGNLAFSSCTILSKLIIPDNVETIASQAFKSCKGLTTITIGKGIKSIGDDAFSDCTALKKIIYNNETNAILKHAFYSCSNWTEIEINSDNTKYKVEDNILYSKDGTKLIRVPQGRSGVFEVPNDVTTIEACAVDNCSKLTEVRIGSNVASIGNLAFNACTKLATIVIDSETVAKNVSGSGNNNWGNVINTAYVRTIYINNTIDRSSVNSFITSNYAYNETSDRPGYYMYTK